MGEMLTYIFSSLRSSEKRLDVVTRAVSKQRSSISSSQSLLS
jgi:hypothetical protein